MRPAKETFLQGRSCSSNTDGDLPVASGANSYIYFLQEVKDEVGWRGVPAFEATHYWIQQILASEGHSSNELESYQFYRRALVGLLALLFAAIPQT